MENIYQQEIIRFHRFLEAWLKGGVARGNGDPERLTRVLSDNLVVVHPNGTRASKPEVVRAFVSAYGEKPSGYALEIDRVETRMIADGVCLATYEERHRGEAGRARVAAAILRKRGADGVVEWLFLQETPAPRLEAS